MKKNTIIRLRKLAATPNPDCQPAEASEYKPGSIELILTSKGMVAVEDFPNEGKSLPIDYTLQGALLDDVQVGQPLRLARTHRNGIEMAGFTETSPIQEIGPDHGTAERALATRNSIYLLEVIEQPQEGI